VFIYNILRLTIKQQYKLEVPILKKSQIIFLAPTCIIFYVILHLSAYNFLLEEGGFYSYSNNLFCDLMLDNSDSDLFQKIRITAKVGHVILAIGMISFFYIIPHIFNDQNRNITITKYAGMLSMTMFIFLSTQMHDTFVTITGILGLIALIPLFLEYYKNRDYLGLHSYYGMFCVCLSLIVFFIFETKYLIDYLPPIQIISFILDSIWVFWVSYLVGKRFKLSAAN
jgi:hypothetical protein